MSRRLQTGGAYVATAAGQVYGELRGCVHCQYKWTYVPGSGTTRGVCLSCYGLLCERPECWAEQRRHLAWAERNGWILTRSCLPFTEWCYRTQDRVESLNGSGLRQGEDFILDQTGLYIPLP